MALSCRLAALIVAFAVAPALLQGQGVTGVQPATQPAARSKSPSVGEKAVDFSLKTLDGKTVALAELVKSGPVVIIELRGWVGYQCPVCTKQVGEMISNSKAILATGAHVVLIYPGPADQLKAHAEEFISGKGLPEGYSFVLDPGMGFVSSAGLRWEKAGETAFPATFVIDKSGIVRFVKVSETHAGRSTSEEVVKALESLTK